jgi:tRNA(Leu) C34 or U34 (ribose-2'-O)-methylase TrmL
MEEYGLSAREAAASATKEIALAVVATTLSLLVIFLPVVFMGGRVGRFFSSFGYVVGFSILMSMFISFTMTPMLCSRFLKADDGRKSKGGFVWRAVEGSYMAILGFSLRHRWIVVLTTVGCLASTPLLMAAVGKDFVPRDDQSEFEVAVTLPEGYTLDRADRVLGEVERRLRRLPGVTNTFIVPICKVDHIKDAVFHLQASGIKVIAATEKTDQLLYEVSFKEPCAIIMGSEGRGINPSVLSVVDDKAKLPILGEIESLNVSVACGAFLYEVVRQRLE